MAINQTELGDILRKEFAEPETPKEETSEEVQTPEETEEVNEDAEIVSEDTTEVESEEVEEQETSEEGLSIEDLNQLATAIEVEPEFLYNIKIPMANGLEPISLSELKDTYTQSKQGTIADREALDKQRVDFEEYKKTQETAIQQQMALPQEIVAKQAEALAIASQHNSYDWEILERENPGQAALEKQKLATAYQQAQSEYQQLVGDLQKKQMDEQTKMRAQERVHMLEKIPEWNDDSQRVKDQEQMRTMFREYGYTDQEIDGIADHRAMKLGRDLWQAKIKTAQALKVVKKVAKIPKTVKAGTVVKDSVSQKKLQQTLENAKKSKNLQVKTRAIGDLLTSRG